MRNLQRVEKELIISIDYDGVLANERYIFAIMEASCNYKEKISLEKQKEILKASIPELIIFLIDRAKGDYVNRRIVVGSNRQTIYFDYINSQENNTASCFIVMDMLREILEEETQQKWILDKRLLPDTFQSKEFGYNFEKGLSLANKAPEIFPAYDKQSPKPDAVFFDSTKITLLYFQLHSFGVSMHEEKKYLFYDFLFIDDNQEIIKNLCEIYFCDNLLPRGANCELYYYDKMNRTSLEMQITGTGLLDYNYAENIKLLVGMYVLNGHIHPRNKYLTEAESYMSADTKISSRLLYLLLDPSGGKTNLERFCDMREVVQNKASNKMVLDQDARLTIGCENSTFFQVVKPLGSPKQNKFSTTDVSAPYDLNQGFHTKRV